MAEKRDRRPRNEEQPEFTDEVKDVSEDSDEEFEDIDTEDEDSDETLDEEASGRDAGFHR